MPQKYGYMANNELFVKEFVCLICQIPNPSFSWTDYFGEAYCETCGTPYQLKGGKLHEDETYPRINIKKESIPILQQYWNETHRGNGLGTFMLERDYKDQFIDREAFAEWDERRINETL